MKVLLEVVQGVSSGFDPFEVIPEPEVLVEEVEEEDNHHFHLSLLSVWLFLPSWMQRSRKSQVTLHNTIS